MSPGNSRELPIGVFDSGVGGLSVVGALKRELPGESFLYLGDTARLPYGTKSPDTVRRYTRRNVEFLLQRGVKAVVVACNTASALALPDLEFPVPSWGVIQPGAREATRQARRAVGVIATESTVQSQAYALAVQEFIPELAVTSIACPLFVPLVEEGWHDDPVSEQVARRYLAPFLEKNVEALILGCTHYPLLIPTLKRVLGDEVRLVDSAGAVAGLVASELKASGDLRTSEALPPSDHFCVTDAAPRFERIARQFLQREEISLELVDLP